ncbi:glycosyltransferase family 4 protein [Providencia rettgeri]
MSVIFIGPKLKPITGQSLAFSNIKENFHGNKLIVEYGGNSILSHINSILFGLIKIFIYCLKNRNATMYITTSRSKLGFLRDAVFINLTRLFSVRIINHLHGADFKDFYLSSPSILKKIINLTYKKISVSIVLLPRMREQYDMFPNMKVVSINNGCPLPNPIPTFEKKEKNKVLYLSNVMYSKGITFLIDAIDKIKEKNADINLIIAGNILGDEYKSQKEMSKLFFDKISNKEYIKYIGPITGTEKTNLLSESLFFVLPTFYKTEAQPLSLIEAMLYGCICITTNHNYLPDIMSMKNGITIGKKNSEEIIKYIIEMLNNEKKQKEIFYFNLKYSREKFSLDSHINNVISLL